MNLKRVLRTTLAVCGLLGGAVNPAAAQVGRPYWERVVEHAPWSARDSCGEVVFKGHLWLLGGWVALEGPGPRDVWKSPDGKNWTRVVEQAPWTHADLSTMLVFKDRMWLMAGWHGGRSQEASPSNEVWSSVDGAVWERATPAAQWGARLGAAGVVFKDKMWILGGAARYFDGSKYLLNDVWASGDGKNWTQVSEHAPWSPRAYHAALVFNDRIWVFGGGNYRPDHLAFNDVWSSADGLNWTQVTGHAPWPGRIWFSAVVYRDRMWLLGGWSDNPSKNWNDVWSTADGKTWEQLKTATIWSPRHETSAWVFNDSVWLAAGNPWPVVNEVWRLTLPGASSSVSASSPAGARR